MNEFVSSRRVSIVTTVASLLVLWAIAVVPGGPAWPGFVSLSVLAVFLVAATRLVLGAALPASMAEVIHGVEGERAAVPVVMTAGRAAARSTIL
jgi:hypothetical protein